MSVERRIECTSGRSPKLLARATKDGIKFWCELHRREELWTWKELEALRHSFVTQTMAVVQ
jgi:hypothetical protein